MFFFYIILQIVISYYLDSFAYNFGTAGSSNYYIPASSNSSNISYSENTSKDLTTSVER